MDGRPVAALSRVPRWRLGPAPWNALVRVPRWRPGPAPWNALVRVPRWRPGPAPCNALVRVVFLGGANHPEVVQKFTGPTSETRVPGCTLVARESRAAFAFVVV